MAGTSRCFDKELYVRDALDAAAAAYADFAEIKVEDGDATWNVSFDEVDEDFDPEHLASEFSNYVLAGTVERKRRHA